MPPRPTPRNEFVDYVLDQLRELGGVTAKRMFGGHGLYSDGVFFAIIHADTLYLKTDDASRAAFVERDCEPFRPTDKITLRTYYETPSDVLEHVETLTAWARRAVEAKRDEDDANDPGRAKPTKTPRRHTRRRRG